MSFGFSVGDFIAAANIAATVISALSTKDGAPKLYQDLITDLEGVQETFLHLSKMKMKDPLGSNGAMEQFLAKNKNYDQSLKDNEGSGSKMIDAFRKIGWTMWKLAEVQQLRETLQIQLTSINVLVSMSSFYQHRQVAETKFKSRPSSKDSDWDNEITSSDFSLWEIIQGKHDYNELGT
ncbi:hypothetical protein N431DRAFT_553973 [Stipitochalara longipes BDJ]|nr:hypothetical protein N431DRAFT_553973 [Stipitochalara longipes BDJ]